MSKPKIKITLVDKIGDTFDYDTERGQLCPMTMHVAFSLHRHPPPRR